MRRWFLWTYLAMSMVVAVAAVWGGLLMLVFAVALLATTMSIAWKRRAPAGKLLLGIQVTSLVGVVVSYLVWAIDFFNTAFSGVG
jgi:hypothetical protein